MSALLFENPFSLNLETNEKENRVNYALANGCIRNQRLQVIDKEGG